MYEINIKKVEKLSDVTRIYCHGSVLCDIKKKRILAENKAVGVMKPGHCFTIEPMINEGSWRDEQWPDHWTAVTADGSRSAQVLTIAFIIIIAYMKTMHHF